MHAHATHARMARVTVVKPVVMIGHIVGATFRSHTTQWHLTRVPKVVVGVGAVLWVVFYIERSIALVLVRVASCFSIEYVAVVYPHFFRFFDRDAIVVKEHYAQVAHLYVVAAYQNQSPVAQVCIIAHTLEGDVHCDIVWLTFDLHSIGIAIELLTAHAYVANEANSQGPTFQSLFITFQYFSQAGKGCFFLTVEDG